MTIKKPRKTAATAGAAVPATGGATIANRLKLDMPDPGAKKPAPTGVATKCAATAALIALAVAGILTFILYKHWEFLMPA